MSHGVLLGDGARVTTRPVKPETTERALRSCPTSNIGAESKTMTPSNRVLVVAVGSLTLWACGGTPPATPTRAQAVAALTGNVTTGQTLYSNNCISCHGATGVGTPSGDSLLAPAKTLSTADIANIVINGKGKMMSYGSFYKD